VVGKQDRNWKLRLRYGTLRTPYRHVTIVADGTAEDVHEDFGCPDGRAWMAMKAWASSDEQAFEMIRQLGRRLGFFVDGRIELYESEPDSPPREEPYGYFISFSPYVS
jgi:hypothetical protein